MLGAGCGGMALGCGMGAHCRNLMGFQVVFVGVEPKKRVDRTAAARKRRQRERDRGVTSVTPAVTLSTAALLAEQEARAVLGSDFDRFGAAVQRYVQAVDTAEYARRTWVELGRPVRDSFANGMAGIHPALKALEQLDAQASRFAGELGLTPASAKRISGVRGAGRPQGAASAADRKAAPALKLAQ